MQWNQSINQSINHLICVKSFLFKIISSKIGDHVKIENCVILDGVSIGSNSHLTGSLALEGCCIGSGVEMKDSLVGIEVDVEEKSKVTNESLVKNMMEI